MHSIVTINPVWTICNAKIADLIKKNIFYKEEIWVYNPATRKKSRHIYTIPMVEKVEEDMFFFYTGLINKVRALLKQKKVKYKYETEITPVEYDDPFIKGVVFRKFQKKAFTNILNSGRGWIKAATGVGKTTVLHGIISAFSQENILVLCHSIDILSQMEKEFKAAFGDDVSYYKRGKTPTRITLSTDKSFIKIAEKYDTFFDVVLIDEAHHVAKFDCIYAKILRIIQAPVRIGVTASSPDKPQGKMCIHALLGPQLLDYDIKAGQQDGILATADLKIIKSPAIPSELLFHTPPSNKARGGRLKKPSTYQKVYYNGIANSESRNLLIVIEAINQMAKGKSILINVVLVRQGTLLQEIFKDLGHEVSFVHGKTPQKERNKIKNAFEKKIKKIVIASTVWKEGVNITSIDVCINGSGHKSEIAVMQKIGRGLRKTKDKSRVLVIDFDDSNIHRYLEAHFRERRKVFKDLGWWDNRI